MVDRSLKGIIKMAHECLLVAANIQKCNCRNRSDSNSIGLILRIMSLAHESWAAFEVMACYLCCAKSSHNVHGQPTVHIYMDDCQGEAC